MKRTKEQIEAKIPGKYCFPAAGRLALLAGMPWMAAAGVQIVAGMAFALSFRMIEPLKSLKLIIAGTESV